MDDEKAFRSYDHRLMRRMLAFVRPYRGHVAVAAAFAIAEALAALAGPLLTKEAIDKGIRHGDLVHLDLVAGVYLCVLAASILFAYVHHQIMQRVAQRVTMDLRMAVFSHLQRVPVSFYDGQPVGKLLTRVTGDVDVVQELVTGGVGALFSDLFLLVGIVVAMCQLNVELLTVAFSVLPLIVVVTLTLRSRVRRTFRDMRNRYALLMGTFTESLAGMDTIQLLGAEPARRAAYRRANEAHREVNLRAVFDLALIFPALELVGALAVALIVWYGGRQVMWTGITLGTLVAFIQYTQRFFRPVADLSEKNSQLQQAMAAAERIFALLDTPAQRPADGVRPAGVVRPADGVRPAGELAAPAIVGRVEFERVGFAYTGGPPVLEDVTFTIEPGTRVALVGGSGSGKTTLMNLLLGFYEPRHGEIRLDGRPLREWPAEALRLQMGAVLQDVFLFTGTIAGNLDPRGGTPRDRLVAAARDVQAHDFIERLPGGYDAPVGDRGATLSAGQRQLIAYARALAGEPRLLLLDEATSSVDPQTESLLQAGVGRLLRGRTCLVIAHRLATVQGVDRIVVLHRGRVRELGTHRELLARDGIYRRLHDLQFRPSWTPQARVPKLGPLAAETAAGLNE
ncbi:MAG: ABC transporter ATP-binding protein [Candidatus Eisenbacteria bacterium]